MKRWKAGLGVGAAVSILVVLVSTRAQMSSPTRMTLGMERGPAWTRLRTAIPAIMAGGGYNTEFATWNIAASLDGFGKMSFFEALDAQEPLFVSTVEASMTQIPDGTEAVKQKLSSAKVRLIALDVPELSSDESNVRRTFQFAKNLNVETIVTSASAEMLATIDRIANETGVNVAIPSTDAKSLLTKVTRLSHRVGACIDARNGVRAAEDFRTLGDRVMAVRLLDNDVNGVVRQVREAMNGLGTNPSFISIRHSGTGDPVAGLSNAFAAFEKALQPIAAERVMRISKTTPIRGPERLQESDRNAVIAAAASIAAVPTKKPRKLLIVDLNIAYPGHGSIPAANLAIKLWGEKTHAYTGVFDNNLENLRYPAIRQFDAVFLNNTVGQVFPDPAVRDGLIRFVNEGGGLAAYHGTPHASMDWPAFGDMLAARGGSHRDPNEKAAIRIEDPNNPVTAAFGGRDFEWQDEFFRFTTPPWERSKVHVLLSFDNARTDLHQKPDCDICNRVDDDYPVSWIRSYGKGRIFYTTLGHRPTLFENPITAGFVLAGIQFVLGDLDAATTPGTRAVTTTAKH